MTECQTGDVGVTILDQETYSEAEAARLLRVPQPTLHYWLEGGERRGRTYPPVIRVSPAGRRTVTWAEFIEAGLIRAYRRHHHVPMKELREFIERLRQEYQVPYPLAHRRPFVSGRRLIVQAQEAAGLGEDFWLVMEETGGQLLLAPSADEFFGRVEFAEDDVPLAWRPDADAGSPVRVNPLSRGGRPNVAGISTEVLWEHVEAGEDPRDVARDFDLDERSVRWALAYENSVRAAA